MSVRDDIVQARHIIKYIGIHIGRIGHIIVEISSQYRRHNINDIYVRHLMRSVKSRYAHSTIEQLFEEMLETCDRHDCLASTKNLVEIRVEDYGKEREAAKKIRARATCNSPYYSTIGSWANATSTGSDYTYRIWTSGTDNSTGY